MHGGGKEQRDVERRRDEREKALAAPDDPEGTPDDDIDMNMINDIQDIMGLEESD